MIKNPKQAGITKGKLIELKKAKAELEAQKDKINDSKFIIGMSSFNNLIEDLESQLSIYENLRKGSFHCWKPESLIEVPKVLISARLAQKMSHKILGDLVGLKEQQIQRYEATDYETASWPRIIEIAEALQVKFYFEKVLIINTSGKDDAFMLPKGVSADTVKIASEKIKDGHSLIFC